METNFIKKIIEEDLNSKKHGEIITRFPPEPNGHLHIGHAKSIVLNFSLAQEFSSQCPTRCHLRFDDTNPEKEDEEFVEGIQEDIKWLGFDWKEHLYFASDYFETLYEFALHLIKQEKAYVCDLSPEEIRESRGTLTTAGMPSPFRNRSVEENLKLFEEMKNRKYKEGEKVLRAKIDMNHPNITMRDPVLYRIKFISHQRTGDHWCLYPMYDFTHSISDALEHITHSLCTLEFEEHRPLYEWFLENCPVPSRPRQIEFARLNLDYTVMSKRKLTQLVEEKIVKGWDDPRMPTIKGLRRRGIPPEAIKKFCHQIGITKKQSLITYSTFENCIRQELDPIAYRLFAVLRPVKVILENLGEEEEICLEVENHPKNTEMGKRKIFLTKHLYIDSEDFLENPPEDFFRLKPEGMVRLRFGPLVAYQSHKNNPVTGKCEEIICRYIPDSFHGKTPDGIKKVKGIIHWVSARHSHPITVNLYDRLFMAPNPSDLSSTELNPLSLEVLTECLLEKNLSFLSFEHRYQFERLGLFALDSDSCFTSQKFIFNRIVSLKDTYGGPTK